MWLDEDKDKDRMLTHHRFTADSNVLVGSVVVKESIPVKECIRSAPLGQAVHGGSDISCVTSVRTLA